jgi:hypothetical protein
VYSAKGEHNSLSLGRENMAIRVLNENEWARIIAKAYLDGTIATDDLTKDPKRFVDEVRAANDPPGMGSLDNPVRLLNIDYSHYSGGTDSEAKDVLAIFQGSDSQQLQDLFRTGNFLNQPVEMPPGEWITDVGLTRPFLHSAAAISLTDWMRIYAYIWHQTRFANNTTIREHFEEDPAKTLQDEIIASLNADPASTPKINYTYRQTPLFTLGAPAPQETSRASKPTGMRWDTVIQSDLLISRDV